MDSAAFQISRVPASADLAGIASRLINQLPAWFAIPEANAEYVESATRLPGLVAQAGTDCVGVLLHRRHFTESAEIHLMAVAPAWHRQGVGRALVDVLVADLKEDDCQVLQVKTLGASHPDPGYARTRAFYRSLGFLPLEETNDLSPGTPCLIMAKWVSA
ncbi:GNAT family N-acetyltransferase [Streptomyces sp. NPDC001380]|uniref:GNAT family N-acetyltransferase n=1 Tax=Streptomyces sp. NPDC001380 TaxID=3364566 RepID=UPI00368E807D